VILSYQNEANYKLTILTTLLSSFSSSFASNTYICA
jgi:hypothetical protein